MRPMDDGRNNLLRRALASDDRHGANAGASRCIAPSFMNVCSNKRRCFRATDVFEGRNRTCQSSIKTAVIDTPEKARDINLTWDFARNIYIPRVRCLHYLL